MRAQEERKVADQKKEECSLAQVVGGGRRSFAKSEGWVPKDGG